MPWSSAVPDARSGGESPQAHHLNTHADGPAARAAAGPPPLALRRARPAHPPPPPMQPTPAREGKKAFPPPPSPPAASQQAAVDAALLILERMGLSPGDLTATPRNRAPVPTFAEYVPVVSAGVSAGTRKAYG